ncbi:hypothetical protein [Clostridium tertium]|nr:hypothetical protein [Clostridium tertium]MBP1868616.1 hypothetical protein [Clostridium tertium]
MGIDWINLNYKDSEEVSDAIRKIIAIMSCVLVLNHLVLYKGKGKL